MIIRKFINIFGSNMKNSATNESPNDEKFKTTPFVFHEVVPNGHMVPKARSGHRMITDEHGNVYVLGGYNPEEEDTSGLLKDMWKFNFALQRWTPIISGGNFPQKLCSFAALSVDDCMFVHGGTGIPFAYDKSRSLYVCKLKLGSWSKIRLEGTGKDRPLRLYGQAIAFDADDLCIYSVGGTTGEAYVMNVYKYDLKSRQSFILDEQTSSHNAPVGRYRHEIVLHKKKIYVFGGGTETNVFRLDKLPVFDLAARTWSYQKTFPDDTSNFPRPRKCHGCVSLGNKVFIVGGRGDNYICDDLWRFDIETSQWTLIAKMPIPLFFHAVSTSPAGLMTIFGGAQNLDNPIRRTKSFFSLWLTVPPLKELAWYTFLNHCPNIVNMSYNQLYDLGIPKSYLARLYD